jgi:exodeoxyribonuclease VII small subunit
MIKMKKAKGYTDVLKELEETLERMNRGEIPIDELEEAIKSAAGKIRYLRDKLKATEAEIVKVLREIEGEPSKEDEGK